MNYLVDAYLILVMVLFELLLELFDQYAQLVCLFLVFLIFGPSRRLKLATEPEFLLKIRYL